ncbi:MAG: transposase [Burkholderiales bacterium]
MAQRLEELLATLPPFKARWPAIPHPFSRFLRPCGWYPAKAEVQRCQLHKLRNVLSHLPENHHVLIRRALKAAWGMRSYDDAKGSLQKLRQEQSVPKLAIILDWLTATQPKVLPKSPLGDAIGYALRHWSALTRYIEDGRLEIDNNGAERSLRTIAVGRKNWTFLGNERAGKSAAILYSLIMSAKAAGVDPRLYIRDLLLRVGHCKDVATLTPSAWKAQWLPEIEAHRQSILERLLAPAN